MILLNLLHGNEFKKYGIWKLAIIFFLHGICIALKPIYIIQNKRVVLLPSRNLSNAKAGWEEKEVFKNLFCLNRNCMCVL